MAEEPNKKNAPNMNAHLNLENVFCAENGSWLFSVLVSCEQHVLLQLTNFDRNPSIAYKHYIAHILLTEKGGDSISTRCMLNVAKRSWNQKTIIQKLIKRCAQTSQPVSRPGSQRSSELVTGQLHVNFAYDFIYEWWSYDYYWAWKFGPKLDGAKI